tara:strand:- start:642 stop:887 length:246 start_codon:yes stop_codon:yes gene_type:complete
MPAELDDFLCEIQCEESYGFQPSEEDYETFDPEDDDVEDWPDRDGLPHEDDEDSSLIDETGGLTAEGYEILAQLDAAGYFV